MTLAQDQHKNRSDLVAGRAKEANKLAALKVEKAAAEGDRQIFDADLGPVRRSR
jgi:hypothetical protein